MLVSQLAKRLQDHLSVTEEAARWAVESWALALGVSSGAELGPAPQSNASRAPTVGGAECFRTTESHIRLPNVFLATRSSPRPRGPRVERLCHPNPLFRGVRRCPNRSTPSGRLPARGSGAPCGVVDAQLLLGGDQPGAPLVPPRMLHPGFGAVCEGAVPPAHRHLHRLDHPDFSGRDHAERRRAPPDLAVNRFMPGLFVPADKLPADAPIPESTGGGT